MQPTYHLQRPEAIPSPSLLVYLELVKANIQHAIDVVGDVARLRPHVKTHKTPEVVALERDAGITKHKCATLREAKMLAESGITDIVIAYQLVGPNISRFITLKQQFPDVDFKPIVDHTSPIRQLSDTLEHHHLRTRVLLDLDVAVHRSGIPPGDQALALYKQIADSPSLEPYGLHVYDGPVHENTFEARQDACAQVVEQVDAFKQLLKQNGFETPLIIMGGTPSFPFFARVDGVETSPGTFIFHDYNYSTRYPDLGFRPAALLLSRVISASTTGIATLDLGYKAISPDSTDVRGVVWNLDNVEMDMQNEEHWMLQLPSGLEVSPGDVMLVCPAHICPTVALHEQLYVIDADGNWIDTWPVAAREREID